MAKGGSGTEKWMEAAMPKDAPVNTGAAPGEVVGPHQRVSEMQAKLHRWAAADPGRRFDDLFKLVCDPATLLVAFERVAGNTGTNTPGVGGLTVALSRSSSVRPGSWTISGPR
jgi:RNA-directed DNA polymerase